AINPSTTAVWPPTGIAVAACLLMGRGVWPAVFAGAFVANLTNAGSVATSIGIGVGNTVEALLGAYFIDRFAAGRHAFERAPDVFRFAALAGFLATSVSATKRSEEHTSELQSRGHLVCRLLLEKKKRSA